MKRLSIQVRLALWYFVSVAAIIVLFAAGSWFALRASMYHSIDRDLGYRLTAVLPFIQNHQLNSREQFARAFSNSSDAAIVGVFVQITDDASNVVYESDILASHNVPAIPTAPADGSVAMSTEGRQGWPVRVASRHVVVNGAGLTVHVAEPLRDMLGSLREYTLYFSLLVPLALLLTTSVGYWMSRRALVPVEQIRKEADAIDPEDLTTRLRVPESDDELARLAQTLNSMLGRIEAGFCSIQQFTADASHELRAPLALILTAGEVSLRRERTREELAATLEKVVKEARRMAQLVDDLLTLARGDGQRRAAKLEPVDIAALLRELCSEFAPITEAKALQLRTDLPQGATFAMGAGADLRRLFVILIDNAVKYTEEGTVSVKLYRGRHELCVEIQDTGIGIEKGALPHIFDRFWRADTARSRAEGGAGLGLSLASQIMLRMGGRITVESEPDSGSIFIVELKAADLIESNS